MKKIKSDKIRIAVLGHKRIPSREGGVEIVAEELAYRMVNLGHSVTCYNRRGHHIAGEEFDAPKDLKEYKGIQIKSVPTIKKCGLSAVSSSLFAAIKTAFGKYDVVHFHAEGPCAFIWLPKFFGKRCIATIHGLDHKRAKWGRFASFYIRFGEKCAVRFADEIIVLSENVRQYFKEKYNRETIFIPNGVNKPKKINADEITNLWGIDKNDYILYLGRLVPEKGVKYLIEAYKKSKLNKKLVIAGGTSDSSGYGQELFALAKDDPNIIFTGFVEGKKLAELYSNAYIYCLPSDLEGMPLSLLEAMSYGNCCVTSDIPECATVLENYGVIFEKGNVDQLAKALKMLCDDEKTVKKYKEQASEYICSKYNWDDVVLETLKLYGVNNEPQPKGKELQKV